MWGCWQRRTQRKVGVLLEQENQETQQPHPGEGNTPEKNPHCVTVVLPEKDAGGVNFFCRCGVVRKEARRGRATQSGEDHEVKIVAENWFTMGRKKT